MPQFLTIQALEGHLALVSLNRPQSANALSTALASEIKDYFSAGLGHCRAVVLMGEGKHFCAGADLKERHGMDISAWKTQHHAFRAARDAILACPIPTIAAVHGAAYGGGLELALACDFIYAADNARFALTEATLGIMPGMGGTQTLPRAVGDRRAKELLFTGRSFTAQEAHAWGMVNQLCSPATLQAQALDCARAIAMNAPFSVKAIKQSVGQGAAVSLSEAFEIELSHYNTLLTTRDRIEGIAAFNEKRKPVFTGE